MKKLSILLCSMILILSLSGVAGAGIYFQPDPPDLMDLDHHYYYTWGLEDSYINGEIASWSGITGINLIFDNIWNHSNETSKLFVWLLEDPGAGVATYSDGGGNDAEIYDDFLDSENRHAPGFTGILLNTYETPDSNGDPSDDILAWTKKDIVYSFSEAEVTAFVNYLGTGNSIGLGFDSDCHYYNDGITLELIPEPAAILLLGVGLIGLAGIGRRRFFNA
jgi:PEP-CTERM motif-containing protein